MPRNQLLYNYDLAIQQPFVVLVEGPTDVWRAGPASVAPFGKSLSNFQRHLLTEGWGRGAVTIMLDGDAQEDAQRIYSELSRCVARCVLAKLPEGTDPGGLEHGEIWTIIARAAREQGVDLAALQTKTPTHPDTAAGAAVGPGLVVEQK